MKNYDAISANEDVPTKKYVDDAIAAGGSGATEVFVQAAQPSAAFTAAIWVDTDESAPAGPTWWSGTQASYDAISTKDPQVMYIITA